MKKILITVCLLFSLSVCAYAAEQVVISKAQMKKIDGLIYKVGDEKPFTGMAEVKFPTGELLATVEYKDGKKNGKYTSYYENGKKKSEQEFYNDRGVNVAIQWYENGQKQHEAYFSKTGEMNIMHKWNADGKLTYSMDSTEMDAGKAKEPSKQ